jgi:rhamnulokinase
MSQFYVGCVLGEETGRVVLGNLHQDTLQVSEVRNFSTAPVQAKDSLQWDISRIFHETVDSLRTVASYEEPVQSISFSSTARDCFLFDEDGALITPALHHGDPQGLANRQKLVSRVPWATIYEETGLPSEAAPILLQLGAEPSKRLKKTRRVLSLADSFNYLLSGEARMELSMAGASSLFNPQQNIWSRKVLDTLKLRPEVLPTIVPSGTVLGAMRADLQVETKLEDVHITASCSEETAAMLAALPVAEGESWAFLSPGPFTLVGTHVPHPIINEVSAQLNFMNHVGFGGAISFCKRSAGLHILDECRRFWEQSDRNMDGELLSHLAGSATPFESLIDPSDPRFATPGDMPAKIQAFCKETNQPVPRKPGPIYRCVLESLALHFRKLIYQLEHLTGQTFQKIYVPYAGANMLLNHFTTNALQVPLTLVSGDLPAVGNIAVQALALGHIRSPEAVREVLRRSSKTETILPHARLWEQAYERFVTLTPEARA